MADQHNFDGLYERYRRELLKVIQRIVHREDAAEDLLQEVFIRAWNRSNELPDIRNPRTWLTRIAVNLSLNELRRRNRSRETPMAEEVYDDSGSQAFATQKALVDFSTPGPESELIRNSSIEVVRKLIGELPEDKRDVLELAIQHDLSVREVSAELGIPDGTVKSRLHYGKKILSAQIRSLLE